MKSELPSPDTDRWPGQPASPRLAVLFALDPQTADDFFRSVRGAFQKNEESAAAMGYALVASMALLVLVALARPWLRQRGTARRQQATLSRLMTARSLSRDDLDLLATLAIHAGTHPLMVATHIDVFERATAAELRGLRPTLVVREGTLHARVGALRERLGFAAHTEHDPLITTRELRTGQAVELLGARTTIVGVTEAHFLLLAEERFIATVGTKVPLTILNEHGASYSVASPLLAVEATGAGWTLIFAHDEAPARQQQRQFVRVPAEGSIQLVGRPDAGPGGGPARHLEGSLLDVSLHGVAISVKEKLAVRARTRVSFAFRDERFRGLEGVVLECNGPPDGPYRLRLEFRQLSPGDDRRLAAAIAHATTRKSSIPSSARA